MHYLETLHGKAIYLELQVLKKIYYIKEGVDISYLSSILNLDRRTIYKIINQINIKSNNLINKNCLKLNRKNNYFFSESELDYYKIKIEILNDSPAIALAKQFVTTSKVNLVYFSIENYISESSLRRKIKNAQFFFSKYDIDIVIKKNEIYLLGEESAIRRGLMNFFWMTYRGIEWPFGFIYKRTIEDQLDKIVPNSIKKGNKSRREQALYFLAITNGRIFQKKLISQKFILPYEQIFNENICFDNFIANDILKYWPLTEVRYLYLTLLTLSQYFLTTDYIYLIKKIEQSNLPINYIILTFLKFIKSIHPEWEINYSKDKEFYAVLISGCFSVLLFRGQSFSLDNFEFQRHLNQQFPNLLCTMEKLVSEKIQNLNQSKTLQFAHILARSYMILFPPCDFEEEIIICLETDMPLYVDKYIEFTLRNILSAKFNVKVNFFHNLNKKADLVLSTNPVQEIDNKIFINPEVTDKDILNIFSACEKIRNENINN